ncbi:hypothetical protein PHSY_004037 [Pseudozyma hubeiensis SY62]|uniref:Uncharacterized protein n=1 Tax=Pseudozyma hubeiensis (strain SY62) TaxID=1305764 RepID=R9P5F3_PSEHS|nr:hypothetical protein PHSY_004037 [Pseudozyma hubeiensis SY62]GAC96457.1 hypothetical protein PHSY_004037 [Pseudozyma hubeiensis SY62]
MLRRASLRRRTPSGDSTTVRVDETAPKATTPTPSSRANAMSRTSSAVASAPVAATVAPSLSATTPTPAGDAPASSGRLSRFFGRRKSFSGPVGALHKPDLMADPVPVLRDASASLNKRSPPLAIISADWREAPDATKPAPGLIHSGAPAPPPATSPSDTAAGPSANIGAATVKAQRESADGQSCKFSAFSFPALPYESSQEASSAPDPSRQKQTKHSTSRSVPLASLPTSSVIPLSQSQTVADDAAMPPPQPRPTRGRSLSFSLSHRKSSKSLSMIGHMFGSSSHVPDSVSSSPPLPADASTLSQRYPAAESRSSHSNEPTASSHSRRPSLRDRLKLGRGAAGQGPQRPSTPEIESWKQKLAEVPAHAERSDTERKSPASIQDVSQPKSADSPVKIVRSRSAIRRKPPPEIKQEDIDSSSSTPVYSKAFRTLDVDHRDASPLGGSPASSPELAFSSMTSPHRRKSSPQSSSRDVSVRRDEAAANVLGLIGAPSEASKLLDTHGPSIDVQPSTPSRKASPKAVIDQSSPMSVSTQQNLAPASSSSLLQRRRTSAAPSVADTSASLDRPWSLISSSEADTPLLKLRKLVVNTDTDASDDNREDDHVSNGLFFRPVVGPSNNAVGSDEQMTRDLTPIGSTQEGELEQLRSASQTTVLSDTKHEVRSVPSSAASTIRVRAAGKAPTQLSLSSAASEASHTSTVRYASVPSALGQSTQPTSEVPMTVDAAGPEADMVGPLPAKSPVASQHSLRGRQHRRDGSVGSTYSQTTIQQARRSSTASRITARSSGQWSESRLSEDALSVLEAEVGQARRAEVVALGKGRVQDWVGGGGADRPLPTAEAPTLSRSNTLRKIAQHASTGDVETHVDQREAQRQRTLNEHLDRRLQQLSDSQLVPNASASHLRVPKQNPQAASSPQHQGAAAMESSTSASRSAPTSATSDGPRFARLSAFHDRKHPEDSQRLAPQDAALVASASNQSMEEAIRLGRAPSKRVRRDASETRSIGEAVMVQRESGARHPRRSASLSSKKTAHAIDQLNPTLAPVLPFVPMANAQTLNDQQEAPAPIRQDDEKAQDDSKKHAKQRTYATSEEAVRAKQLELINRERRLAEKEARHQAYLQQKYAHKKQNDPLLAARLALVGLEPREAVPQVDGEHAAITAKEADTGARGGGLQPPAVPERRASSRLSIPRSSMVRKNSDTGSVASFHTATDAPVAAVRPDTSNSIASSLAVDFDFPEPPRRMTEQLSDDGTVLSRAGLQHSPLGQRWKGRRHYAREDQRSQTPPLRDSSLRHRVDGDGRVHTRAALLFSNDTDAKPVMSASQSMPRLIAVPSLDSAQQTATLRRSRSVGYASRDLRKLTREQMMQDALNHPSPPAVHRELHSLQYGQAKGLGIEMADNSSASGRYSNVATPRQPIAA